MNWLEKKILLHILKTTLERLSTMKLSLALVFQAFASALQYGNMALDVTPPKLKPYVALVIGLLQVLVHWRQAYFNPDGTPASVAYIPPKSSGGSGMKLVTLLCLALLVSFAHPVLAQNAPLPTQTFSITTSAISLPGNRGTFAGTDSGFTFSPTTNFDLANHNIVSSDGKLSSFMGGADYTFAGVSKWMNNLMPNVSGFRLQPSLGGYFGIARVTDPTTGNVAQHYSALISGTVNYSLDSGNHWGLGVRVGALRAPGYANGWVPVVSLPFTYKF